MGVRDIVAPPPNVLIEVAVCRLYGLLAVPGQARAEPVPLVPVPGVLVGTVD